MIDLQELQNQGYVCPNCKKSFTPLDASDLFDPERNILACDVCSAEVDNNENEADVRGNKDRMQRLVEQTRVIRDSLKKMDDVVLPKSVVAFSPRRIQRNETDECYPIDSIL